MTNDYYNYKKSVDDLTSVLSIGYFFSYSPKVIEKRIAESKYFANFSKSFFTSESYVSTSNVLENIFYDADLDCNIMNIFYKEFEWAATVYVNIIQNTGLNFETIFCYLPIEDIKKMFKLYHEMDINRTFEYFEEERKKTSIIKIKAKTYGLTNKMLSEETGLSLSMINALKNRKRDIRKLDLECALHLAKALHLQVETLINN